MTTENVFLLFYKQYQQQYQEIFKIRDIQNFHISNFFAESYSA